MIEMRKIMDYWAERGFDTNPIEQYLNECYPESKALIAAEPICDASDRQLEHAPYKSRVGLADSQLRCSAGPLKETVPDRE